MLPPAPDPPPTLREIGSDWVDPLRIHNTIGRDGGNDIMVDDPLASTQHAVLRWDGERWHVRDLASTNGTFVDGLRITPGLDVPLGATATLGFGDPAGRWRLVAPGPPRAFAESLAEPGRRVVAVNAVLGLPSPDDPQVMVLPNLPHWQIEDHAGLRDTHDRAVVMVDGQPWRLALPLGPAGTLSSAPPVGQRLEVRGTLRRPRVAVTFHDRRTPVTSRRPLRLLWVLAREWVEDRRRTADRGLTHVDLVAAELRVEPNTIDVYVHRLRDELVAVGLFELIERRKGLGQLRLDHPFVDWRPD